jgi:hypothetical protein
MDLEVGGLIGSLLQRVPVAPFLYGLSGFIEMTPLTAAYISGPLANPL